VLDNDIFTVLASARYGTGTAQWKSALKRRRRVHCKPQRARVRNQIVRATQQIVASATSAGPGGHDG
jgi:hypothetical protein